MELTEAIATITAAIDDSVKEASDGPWAVAAQTAGLVLQENTNPHSQEQDYIGIFGDAELHLRWWWRDTSRTFSPGPDVHNISLSIVQNGQSKPLHGGAFNN